MTPQRSQSEQYPQASSRRRGQRKFFRWLCVLLLLVACGLALAPTIISRSGLHNRLLCWALPAPGWRLECQRVTFSWWGRQSLTGISLVDPSGQPLLQAETLTCHKALWELAVRWSQLGKIQVHQPVVSLVTRPAGSNAEDLLAALALPRNEQGGLGRQGAAGPTVVGELEITQGAVRGLDTITQQQWLLADVNLTARSTGTGLQLQGDGRLGSQQAAGRLKLRLQSDPTEGLKLDLLAEQFPLQILQPWLVRTVPGAQLAGTLTLDAPGVRCHKHPQRGWLVRTAGRLEARQLMFTSAALQGDRLLAHCVSAPWEVTVSGNQISLQRLDLDADWAKLELRGTLTTQQLTEISLQNLPTSPCRVTGQLALDRVAGMLPRTLRLREGLQLDAGQLSFEAAARPAASDVTWTAAATVEDVAGSHRGRPLRWQQPIEARVEFVSSPAGPQVKRCLLRAAFAAVEVTTAGEALKGDFQIDLADLADEVGQFVDLSAWQLQGRGEGQFQLAQPAEQQFSVESTGQITDLQMRTPGLALDEPRVQFAGKLSWDAVNDRWVVPELELSGNTLSLRARKLTLQSADPSRARGQVAFRVDLERLAAIIQAPQPAVWPRGLATGQLQLASSEEQLQADFSAEIADLQILRHQPSRPELVWSESQLQLSGRAIYLASAERARLENVRVSGKSLQLSGQASVEEVRSAQQLQASGQLHYDSQELARLLAATLGPDIQLQVDRQVRFEVAGSLAELQLGDRSLDWIRGWQAAADAGWESAAVFGLPIGAGRLHAALQQGQLQLAPLDVAVGQGRLTAHPQVRWTADNPAVFLPAGPLLTNVQISPPVSHKMLQYVAPILAGATRTEGAFSVNLANSHVPLGKPEQARVSGQLAVHHWRVTPGPLIRELETAIRQLKALSDGKQFLAADARPASTLLKIADREIDFQVVEGRVYHRHLEFEIDEVPIRSQGSVGFDQSLALVFEIPLQAKWLGSNLRSLAGQTLQVPLQGTLQKPRLDARVIADLSRRFLREAATRALGDEVNRQLERLFRNP